jgi:hypothetical protein
MAANTMKSPRIQLVSRTTDTEKLASWRTILLLIQ